MRCYVVDAFTSVPFAGNAAGVVQCNTDVSPSSHLASLANPEANQAEALRCMQQVAAEINLSETAFTWKLPGGEHVIRYFTPTTEIALCGHATLATAKVLWETSTVPRDQTIVFRTGVDGQELRCDLHGERIRMVFPGDELDALDDEERLRLLDAFSLTDGDEDVHATCKGRLNADYLIFVTTDFFSRLDQKLNMQKIQEVNSRYGARGVIVTTKRGGDERGIVDEWDIKSRFFCPNAGIPEDPVTGSSFPTLAAFYKLPHFVGLQDHPRRRGFVHVSMLEDGSTAISGDAVMVTTNHFLI